MRSSRRQWLQCAGAAGIALDPGAVSAAGQALDPVAFAGMFAQRQTIRRYKPDPVPDAHLRQILDAARRGPTCMNQQPWKFLVIRSRAKIEAMKKQTLGLLAKRYEEAAARKEQPAQDIERAKLRSLRFTEGYFTAPLYVVVLVDTESQCSGYAINHDGPIAAAYLMLAARAFGYGTAYLTDGIPEEVTREALGIPSRYYRVCITPIGVPDVWPAPQPKRKLEEMVAYETLEGHAPNTPLPYNP